MNIDVPGDAKEIISKFDNLKYSYDKSTGKGDLQITFASKIKVNAPFGYGGEFDIFKKDDGLYLKIGMMEIRID